MKLKLILTAVFLLATATARAEAPCTHIGHETLQGAVACAVISQNTQRMDSHHNQIMANLATQPALPPQAYADSVPNFVPYMILTGHYKGMHYIYPFSWYWTFPGY